MPGRASPTPTSAAAMAKTDTRTSVERERSATPKAPALPLLAWLLIPLPTPLSFPFPVPSGVSRRSGYDLARGARWAPDRLLRLAERVAPGTVISAAGVRDRSPGQRRAWRDPDVCRRPACRVPGLARSLPPRLRSTATAEPG